MPLLFLLLVALGAAALPLPAAAHEAYVLDHAFFWRTLHAPSSLSIWGALNSGNNLKVALFVFIGVSIALIANFVFRLTRPGKALNAFLDRFGMYGLLLVRIATAAALILSALGGVFLAPELPLSAMPHPVVVRAIMLAAGWMLAVGLMTELAAALMIVLFSGAVAAYGSYLVTYVNYLGEFLALAFFGSRFWSFDALLLGKQTMLEHLKHYEGTIIRVLFGVSLIWTAVAVKLLHPELTIRVVNEWHLTQFHLLFPSDPRLLVLGAGITEIVIGLFIIFGFEMRMTVFISLFYLTLSLLYFREDVWPHLLLYGVSLCLLVVPEHFTFDRFLLRKAHEKIASMQKKV